MLEKYDCKSKIIDLINKFEILNCFKNGITLFITMNKKNKSGIKLISDNFICFKCDDIKITIMKCNGYVNSTKIINSELHNKKFADWYKCKNTKEFIEELSNRLNLSEDELIIIKKGGTYTKIRGTYVHPIIMTHISYWISPKFAVKVGFWIEEWKNFSQINSQKYLEAIYKIEPSNNELKEKHIQSKLKYKYNGKTEVKAGSDRIDLLTKKYLIEIKDYNNWKHAIGQLIVYSRYYPKKIKCMYLFNVDDNDTLEIQEVCEENNIILKIYD